ncbi:MAG: AAA family ATPase [Acidobacteriota bacterium]|nr:AAA family ATPase [Acidobacteriota bacterium]
MLTRLKISGFKNLVDIDIRFGPFTCIAGANGVGKSNLFDAIRFLSLLAEKPLTDAALSVRDEAMRGADIGSLFHCVGSERAGEMSFETEMIIPARGTDDLGQPAHAKITFVRYSLKLAFRPDAEQTAPGRLEILEEALDHINLGEAAHHIKFPHSYQHWRKDVVTGRRTSPFIGTQEKDGVRVITINQDGTGGRPRSVLAANLPRTVLSTVNATESPTALLARREMQSWRRYHLEPPAIREPDSFTTPAGIAVDGAHVAITLDRLEHGQEVGRSVCDRVVSRLAELIDDVHALRVDRDIKRELVSLEVTDREGTRHPAGSLSDGTLRFLALAVLEHDTTTRGVLCMEEPENGIHPDRIPALLQLLQDIAVDPHEPVGPDNLLRQVIINTHSPRVVQSVPDDSLLIVTGRNCRENGRQYRTASFRWLADTWREKAEPDVPALPKRDMLPYLLSPTLRAGPYSPQIGKRRVMDRDDLKSLMPMLPGFED